MKTLTELYSAIAKREGKKSQVKIGDIREIIAILSDLMIKHPSIHALLTKNGERRAKKRKKVSPKKKH